jgi:Thioesterase-like superfamily
MAHEAFFEPAGVDTFAATRATAGPWDPGAQHGGPPSALVARAFERHEPVDGQHLSRVCVEILRPVPVLPLTVRVRTVRPGKRITLVEGVVEAGGQEVMLARGWRIAVPPVAAPAADGDGAVPDIPAAERAPQFWAGGYVDGYVAAMDWRFASGGFTVAGAAQAWMRPRVPLVAGEETSPVCRVMLVADSGNGISARIDPSKWLFVNVDLTVALHRPPSGEWVLLDAATTIGPAGAGLAASRLADRDGTIGRGLQTLVVTPR